MFPYSIPLYLTKPYSAFPSVVCGTNSEQNEKGSVCELAALLQRGTIWIQRGRASRAQATYAGG